MRVPAGYGKVAAVERLEQELEIAPDRTIYVGDGSSDVHVMLHVNNRDGFTIAVSENKHIARIARRTVLSDNAFSVLVPVFEQIVGWTPAAIRRSSSRYGLTPAASGRRRAPTGSPSASSPVAAGRGRRVSRSDVITDWLGWAATGVFVASYACRSRRRCAACRWPARRCGSATAS